MACLVGARGPNTTDLSTEEIQALLQAMEDHNNLRGLQRLKGEFIKNNQKKEATDALQIQNQLYQQEKTVIENQFANNKQIQENLEQATPSRISIIEKYQAKQTEAILQQKLKNLQQYQVNTDNNQTPSPTPTNIFHQQIFETTNYEENNNDFRGTISTILPGEH